MFPFLPLLIILNWVELMESRSIISYDESKAIIQCFFKAKFSFPQLLEKHRSKIPPVQIIEHVKGIFQKLLLDIEYELMIADKIKTMQLYENSSKQMFDRLMNMDDILSEEARTDFNIYYRNRVSKVTVYQTDLISSDKRMVIYTAFLEYALKNNLFMYSDTLGEGSFVHKDIQDAPESIFSRTALETIYAYFAEEKGNLYKVEKKLRGDGMFTAPMYSGQLLKANLKNLYLIGLFKVYQAVMRSRNRPHYPWKTFCGQYQALIDKIDNGWLVILFRIAVYDNVTPGQRHQISKMLRKKFVTCNISSRNSEYMRKKEQAMLTKIKKEMKKIMNGDQVAEQEQENEKEEEEFDD